MITELKSWIEMTGSRRDNPELLGSLRDKNTWTVTKASPVFEEVLEQGIALLECMPRWVFHLHDSSK